LDAVTVTVRPEESRTMMAALSKHWPVGVTVKLPPLDETVVGETKNAVGAVLEIVYGALPPKMKKDALMPLPAHWSVRVPWKVTDVGETKKPGLEPVAWTITKLARRKACVPRSVT